MMEDHDDEGDLSLEAVFTVSRATLSREERAGLNIVLGTTPSSYPRPYPLHILTRTRPG